MADRTPDGAVWAAFLCQGDGEATWDYPGVEDAFIQPRRYGSDEFHTVICDCAGGRRGG